MIHEDSEDVDWTTFRVRSHDGVDVWITPLVLLVLTQLLPDLSANVRISMYVLSGTDGLTLQLAIEP